MALSKSGFIMDQCGLKSEQRNNHEFKFSIQNFNDIGKRVYGIHRKSIYGLT